MAEVSFVMSERQAYPLRELAETLRYELELQDVPSYVSEGGFPRPQAGQVHVLLDPLGYLEAEGPLALPGNEVLRRTIFLCPAGLTADRVEDEVELLRRAGSVFVLDQKSVVEMHRAGVPARLLRPGYSKSLDRFDPAARRPIDVMFMGAHSERRTRYLGRAARVLSRHNCLLQISEDTPITGPTSSYLAGSRWPLLAQTKVVIQIHSDDDASFDWRGALDAIHAGAVVVSEQASGISPLVPGQHLLVASPDALPYVVDALLREDERLSAVRAQAHERLSTWIPFALPVSVLRAAVVELVGEPVSPQAPLTGFGLRPADAPPASPMSPELHVMRRELRAARHEAALARRQLIDLQQKSRALAGPAVEVLGETPAWRARRSSRLTAITALSDDCEQVISTLDSLAASRMRDFELVLVSDDSAPDVLMLLKRWMTAHPRIAAALITVDAGHRRGGARNAGVDFVRSPYCLILDPGQLLYPHCLTVLTGTLADMPEIAFVYPIQEVIGEPDAFTAAGGDYLMSFLGWDPGRLRSGNHIHAPALIRCDRLRELGGYATDPRLAGLEDYDLWCRMADRGWRGQLVPQELARRVESGESAALAEIRPSPGVATSALMERSPRLMAGAFPEL